MGKARPARVIPDAAGRPDAYSPSAFSFSRNSLPGLK
jgi:hypothetical protein